MTTGETIERCVSVMRVTIAGHLAVMRELGDAIPEPTGPGVYIAQHAAAAA